MRAEADALDQTADAQTQTTRTNNIDALIDVEVCALIHANAPARS